jgi:DNA repair exonuclease SbcCD ATPase subunit
MLVNNYGSFYGPHEIPIPSTGLIFIRGKNWDEPGASSNGAGKSTLVDALDWGLWGVIPRGDGVKSIINEESTNGCWVMVELLDESVGVKGVIWRYRDLKGYGSGVRFIQGGVDLSALDVAKTQEAIEAFLGIDRTIYRTTIYRAQNDVESFANATDARRKELLTELLPDLQVADLYRERAKQKGIAAEKDLATCGASLTAAEAELHQLVAYDWTAARAQFETQKSARIEQARIAADAAAAAITPEVDLSAAHLKVQLLEATKPPLISTGKERVKQIQGRLTAATGALSSVQAKYQAAKGALVPFESGGLVGKCTRCGSVVTEAHAAQEAARIREEIRLIVEQGKEARHVVTTLEQELATATSQAEGEEVLNQQAAAAYASTLQKARGEWIAANTAVGIRATQIKAYEYAKQMLATAQSEVWPLEGTFVAASHREADIEQSIAYMQEQQATLVRARDIWMFWADALSGKGVKSLLLDAQLSQMSEVANSWIQALTGGTTWVRFETQKANQKGTLSEKLSIRVFRHDPGGGVTERDFRSWSGGEQSRIAFGVDQGVASLVSGRSSKSWGLRILDETFARNLDDEGRGMIFTQIQTAAQGALVFVIDHSNGLAGEFETFWEVEVKERRSRVVFPDGSSSALHGYDPEGYLKTCMLSA